VYVYICICMCERARGVCVCICMCVSVCNAFVSIPPIIDVYMYMCVNVQIFSEIIYREPGARVCIHMYVRMCVCTMSNKRSRARGLCVCVRV
jgi:hypothetical protein